MKYFALISLYVNVKKYQKFHEFSQIDQISKNVYANPKLPDLQMEI